MKKVTLDPAVLALLTGNGPEVEVCDAAGNTVAVVMNAGEYAEMRRMAYDWANAQVSDEELAAAAASTVWHPHADVLKLFERGN